MLRMVKILLILSVAAYCILGMIANVDDWPRTLGSIRGVVSMIQVDGGPGRWQATTSPAVVLIGGIFIVLFKTIAGLLCLAGAWRMWTQRRADLATFAQAKTLGLVGCGVAILGLHFGWVVIAEQVFDLWRAKLLAQSANTAFRYAGSIALIAIFVSMGETDQQPR